MSLVVDVVLMAVMWLGHWRGTWDVLTIIICKKKKRNPSSVCLYNAVHAILLALQYFQGGSIIPRSNDSIRHLQKLQNTNNIKCIKGSFRCYLKRVILAQTKPHAK